MPKAVQSLSLNMLKAFWRMARHSRLMSQWPIKCQKSLSERWKPWVLTQTELSSTWNPRKTLLPLSPVNSRLSHPLCRARQTRSAKHWTGLRHPWYRSLSSKKLLCRGSHLFLYRLEILWGSQRRRQAHHSLSSLLYCRNKLRKSNQLCLTRNLH